MEQIPNKEHIIAEHSDLNRHERNQIENIQEINNIENANNNLQSLPSLTESDQHRFKQFVNQTQAKLTQIKQGVKSLTTLNHLNSHKKNSHLSQSIKRQSNQKQSYTDWKVYQNKSDLNMLPFPYCVDETYTLKRTPSSPHSLFTSLKNQFKSKDEEIKQKPAHFPRLYKLRIQNKLQIRPQRCSKQNKVYRPIFNYEKTPINEYLNYDLAEQINFCLRDVQIMADENRRIRKAKKEDNEKAARQKNKLTKGIKVKRQYVKNFKGLYKNDN